MTDALDPTVGNSTVGSADTAGKTRGDTSDDTPKTSGARDKDIQWSAMDDEVHHAVLEMDDKVHWARSALRKFLPGQQQFPTMSRPELTPAHKRKYLGMISGRTAMSLFDSYTKSIAQPWRQTPYHLQKSVWKETLMGMQQLFYSFHELQLPGWPNCNSCIKGRHPKTVIEEVIHWKATFPCMTAFTLNCMLPRVFMAATPTAPPGAPAGARLPRHVPGNQQFPMVTLRLPTKSHKKKYLKHITVQTVNQIFEDYTESIDQDWRNTSIQHRSRVWGETFDTLQRLFLQFHNLQQPAWKDYHFHTAGCYQG